MTDETFTVPNLQEFNKELDAAVKDMEEKQFKPFIKKIALTLLARIVLKNPVDTGRSRGNWQTEINFNNDDEVVNGKSRGPQDVINECLNKLANFTIGATIRIFNNVPYIIFLENGSSKQAPRGMVAISVEELRIMFQ